jgi:acetyl-CoA carboxylase carboxyl transferase subunit alpha
LTAPRLKELGLIDKVIKEPAGGAHRNPDEVALRLKETIVAQTEVLLRKPVDELLEERYRQLMKPGVFEQG